MDWTYKITAAANPRMLLRVLQLFDQQRLAYHQLSYAVAGEVATIVIRTPADPHHASRIHAKLYNQHDIREVELLPSPAAFTTISNSVHPG